jgi:hypothetical protein
MRLTKLDMARVVVTALYNKPALVAANNSEAVRRAKRGTVESLTRQHAMAMAVLNAR